MGVTQHLCREGPTPNERDPRTHNLPFTSVVAHETSRPETLLQQALSRPSELWPDVSLNAFPSQDSPHTPAGAPHRTVFSLYSPLPMALTRASVPFAISAQWNATTMTSKAWPCPRLLPNA